MAYPDTELSEPMVCDILRLKSAITTLLNGWASIAS